MEGTHCSGARWLLSRSLICRCALRGSEGRLDEERKAGVWEEAQGRLEGRLEEEREGACVGGEGTGEGSAGCERASGAGRGGE